MPIMLAEAKHLAVSRLLPQKYSGNLLMILEIFGALDKSNSPE